MSVNLSKRDYTYSATMLVRPRLPPGLDPASVGRELFQCRYFIRKDDPTAQRSLGKRCAWVVDLCGP